MDNRKKPIFYLVRHCESLGNVDESVYFTTPDHEIGLSEEGRKHSIIVGQDLKELVNPKMTIESIVSPYRRTIQTWKTVHSQLITPGATKIRTTENILVREQEWSQFKDTNERRRVIEEMNSFGPIWYRFQNGESMADVAMRAQTFLNDLRMSHLTGNLSDQVVVVSHAIFLTVLMNVARVANFDLSKRPEIKNGEIRKVELF